MKKKFLYYLLTEDGKSYTVQNGVVTESNLPVQLPNTPDGWQDISIGWERDMKACGIVRNFSLKLGFVLSGATILRKIVHDGSIERKVFLFIARLHTEVDLQAQTFKHVYRKFYKGQLDLSTYEDEAFKFSAAISEGWIKKLYDANKGTTYEFPVSDGDAFTSMDGMYLHNKVRFTLPDGVEMSNNDYTFFTPPLSFINKEGTAPGLAFFTQKIEPVSNAFTYVSDSDNYAVFNNHTAPITIVLKGGFKWITRKNDIGGTFRTWFWTSTGQQFPQTYSAAGAVGTVITVDIDLTIMLAPQEKLFFIGELFGSVTGAVELIVEFLPDSDINVTYTSKYDATTVRGFTLYRLGQQLAKSITGSEDNFYSPFLLANDGLIVTSGDGIRSLEKAVVKTSFNNYTDAVHVLYGLGFGIEGGKIVVAEKSYFLNPVNPINLGFVKDLVTEPDKELLFNTVKIGYNEIATDDVNGKCAFNNTHEYKTEVTNVAKELTLISPYAADPYAIELTRMNLEGKTTTDNSTDNQVFLIDTVKLTVQIPLSFEQGFGYNFIGIPDVESLAFYPVGSTLDISGTQFNNGRFKITNAILTGTGILLTVYEPVTAENVVATVTIGTRVLNRPAGLDITGVPDPATVFNVLLSPKRLLLRHMPWINSVLHDMVGTKLTFQTTEKNAELVAGGIVEKADVTVGTERLFKNVTFTFTAPVQADMVEVLEETPNRSFVFSYDTPEGETLVLAGFSLGIGLAPNDEKEQKIKLLSTAGNNLSNLVR